MPDTTTPAETLRAAAGRTADPAMAALLDRMAAASEHHATGEYGVVATLVHAALAVARQLLGTTTCGCPHPADEHSAYGCANGCACEWMPPKTPAATAEEAREMADELNTELYQARDALAFVGECCNIADRAQRPITTGDVREWLKGARCGRQLLGTTSEADDLGPADGQQKTRLLARLHASLTPIPEETDEEREQREDREETDREHAVGIHTHCGLTCEVDLPTEHLRNFVIAKGYPGTAGALDELLRRAAAPPAPADRATVPATVYAAIRRLAAHAVGFQDVLDEGDQGAWGKTIGADIAELSRLAGEVAAGAHHPEEAGTDQTEGPEAAARRFARRIHAVERLCSGRPGYHTITVKALLTAMSEADDETPAVPAAPEETR
ncbi:hypothetical protein ACIQRW_34105 [Streptomyces sp. NPDC091287]|uniref:hypothetical protein n=1 Tax=Streptomyces sp. NPDC091287 TaxID=3365988 RepID=UPI00381191C8